MIINKMSRADFFEAFNSTCQQIDLGVNAADREDDEEYGKPNRAFTINEHLAGISAIDKQKNVMAARLIISDTKNQEESARFYVCSGMIIDILTDATLERRNEILKRVMNPRAGSRITVDDVVFEFCQMSKGRFMFSVYFKAA